MLPTLDVEIEMFRFFEMTPDLVCIAHKDGFFKNFNGAVVDKLGYTKEELLNNEGLNLFLTGCFYIHKPGSSHFLPVSSLSNNCP